MNQRVSISTLPSLAKDHVLVEIIGKGGNSEVWTVKDTNNNIYAAKVPFPNTINMVIDEAEVMSSLSRYPNTSPFLIYYGLYLHNNSPVMLIEYFDGITLNDVKREKVILDEEKMFWLARGIYTGLNYLHQHNKVHSDIGPQNIMLNEDRIVLIDIGNYDYTNTDMRFLAEIARTTDYYLNLMRRIEPSINKIMQKKDIYDAGMILWELVTGNNEPTREEFISNPRKYYLNIPNKTLETIINLSIDVDIHNRPTARQILDLIPE